MRRALLVDDEAESLGPASRDQWPPVHVAAVVDATIWRPCQGASGYMLSDLNGIRSTMCSNSRHHIGTTTPFEVPTCELGHVHLLRVFFFGRAISSGPMTILLTGGRPRKEMGRSFFLPPYPNPP